MQNELNIIGIQSKLCWENPYKNLKMFQQKIESMVAKVDLIVLPEMFSSGFTMHPASVSETMDGVTVRWMKEIASSYEVSIVGSIVVEEDSNYYNRAVFVHPNQQINTYDKRHLFTLAGEDKVYHSGNNRIIVEVKGWRICPLICYDLRFPVWSRYNNDYDVLLYMANWPETRSIAWDSLLKARAIENMSYCIGVNRVGEDNNGYRYNGHSAIYDPLGEKIAKTIHGEEGVVSCTLSKTVLDNHRSLNFLNDKDNFQFI